MNTGSLFMKKCNGIYYDSHGSSKGAFFAVSFRCRMILEMIIYVIIGKIEEGVRIDGESTFFSRRIENQ